MEASVKRLSLVSSVPGDEGAQTEPAPPEVVTSQIIEVTRVPHSSNGARGLKSKEMREFIFPHIECAGPDRLDLSAISLHCIPRQETGEASCLDVFCELLQAGLLERCLSLADYEAMARNPRLLPQKLKMGEVLLWKSASRVVHRTPEGCVVQKRVVPFMTAQGQYPTLGWHPFEHSCGVDRPAGLLPPF